MRAERSRYLVWLYQHMLGHHPYTNIDGADPDIDTGARSWGAPPRPPPPGPPRTQLHARAHQARPFCGHWGTARGRPATAEKDLRRIKASQRWFDRDLLQHIYVPIIYAALAVKTRCGQNHRARLPLKILAQHS